MDEELLELVNKHGATIGSASRSAIHGDPSRLHKVVHILVFNTSGRLLLQKRSLHKDVAPGKWDTSVGGHVWYGETALHAALREMSEELGVSPNKKLEYLYSSIYTNEYESEFVVTFRCVHNGPFTINRDEIDAIQFYNVDELLTMPDNSFLSNNFLHELKNYTTYLDKLSANR